MPRPICPTPTCKPPKPWQRARQAAQRLLEQAGAAAETESKTRRAEMVAQVQAEADQVQAQAREAVNAMRQRAQERLPAAVALVVAWVEAEG